MANVKCPECGSDKIWGVGMVPARKGKKHRMKCSECARTFYAEDVKPKRVRKSKSK